MIIFIIMIDDPVEALGKLGRGKLKGKSIKKLREEAREEIYKIEPINLK